MINFFKRNKLKLLLKKNNRKHAFLDLNNIHSILVLFETSDYETVDSFVEIFQKMGKTVEGYAYRAKNDVYDYSETNYNIIGTKENSGKSNIPSDEILNRLKSVHYDAVIDLTISENYLLEYILASVNATMTIGLKKNKLPFYDMAISKLPKEPKEPPVTKLTKSILHYLRTINGNKTG